MDNLVFIQTGTGVDVHGQDLNVAAERAIADAIHHNSMPGMEKLLPNGDLNNMKVNVKLGIPRDQEELDKKKIKEVVPEGAVKIETTPGGMTATSGIYLEKHQDKNDQMYIVNAVVEVGY